MKERRKEKRITDENRVAVTYFSNGIDSGTDIIQINALSKDISIGGARILTDTFIPKDTTLKITLILSKSRQIVELQGQVKWVKSLYDDDLFEIGIEFLHKISKTILALIGHLYGDAKGVPTNMSI